MNHRRLAPLLLCTLLYSGAVSHRVETILPAAWAGLCSFSQDSNILGLYVDEVSAHRVFSIRCHVGDEDTWAFSTLQAWLKGFTGFSVFLTVECSRTGTISLPWPMKAKGLVGLKVSNCRLKDKYADVTNQDVSALPDQLRVLDMRDSVWLSDVAAFEFMTRPDVLLNMGADYDCGQDRTLEYMVVSNVTDMLSDTSKLSTDHNHDSASENSKTPAVPGGSHHNSLDGQTSQEKAALSSALPTKKSGSSVTAASADPASKLNDLLQQFAQSSNISETLGLTVNKPTSVTVNNTVPPSQAAYQELLKNIQSLQHTCVYERMRVLDESCPSVMSVHHFSIMVQSGSYPELRTMNYSFSGLQEIPRELREFRVFFPKLSYLDLTKNTIRHVALAKTSQTARSQHLSLDLRYNHITHINLNIIQSWADVKDMFIDIRYNPLDCGCHMYDLLLEMRKQEFFCGSMAPYEYLKEMRCYTPLNLRGQKLSDIELSCSGRLSNSLATRHADDTSLSATNLAVLLAFCGLAVVILAIVGALLVHYITKFGPIKMKEETKLETPQSSNLSPDIESGPRTS